MTTLYRFHSEDSQLLYVGITDKGPARWRSHQREKPWWPEVARITIEHIPDRETAERLEREAIANEFPVYNIADHPMLDDWGAEPIQIYLDPPQATEQGMSRLTEITKTHPGITPVIAHVGQRIWVSKHFVRRNKEFHDDVRQTFGPYAFEPLPVRARKDAVERLCPEVISYITKNKSASTRQIIAGLHGRNSAIQEAIGELEGRGTIARENHQWVVRTF